MLTVRFSFSVSNDPVKLSLRLHSEVTFLGQIFVLIDKIPSVYSRIKRWISKKMNKKKVFSSVNTFMYKREASTKYGFWTHALLHIMQTRRDISFQGSMKTVTLR